MWDLPPLLSAGLTGLLAGLVLSIGVGPINLTIINEGARRGFLWGMLIGLGSSVMDLIYCTLAFTGFSTLFDNRMVKATMELASFVFMLFLGIKFLLAKNITAPTHLSNVADKIEERIERKLHPSSAFWVGFVRVMANPGVLVIWIILAANFISREWVPPNTSGKLACICGVAVGTAIWFVGLSWAVSLGHKKFSEKTLLRMEHLSGICLLVIAFLHGARIVWQMTHHRL